jgi:tetratricopeptide (TPR) repeat protein
MSATSPSRTEMCPCGSGRKFKHCCGGGTVVKTRPVSSAASAGHFADLQAPWRAALRDSLRPGRAPAPRGKDQRASAAQLLARGARLILAGCSADAIPLLQQSVQFDPCNAKAHYSLGLAFLNCGRRIEAAGSLRQATVLQPDYVHAHFKLAQALDLLGLTEQAIDCFRKAVRLDPALAEAHDRLAELFAERNQTEDAIESYRAAIAAAPDTSMARLNEARILMIRQDFTAAVSALKRVLAIDPQCSKAHDLLGTMAANRGRFNEAQTHFGQALAADRNLVSAYLNLTGSKKISDADTELVDRMRQLLDEPMLADPARVVLHFAMGKAMDDLRDFEQAMTHFDAANRLRSRYFSYDRQGHVRWCDKIIDVLAPDRFRAAGITGSDDDRPVFIVGMPRSGTTLIEQIISSHPSVSDGGELLFWTDQGRAWHSENLDPMSRETAARVIADYKALLSSISPDAARVTDKMPFNFQWVGWIHALLPRASIVHCRRHPIDVCLSIYSKRFHAPMEFAAEKRNLVAYYRQYERLMAHWRSVLPPDRLLEVQYETLVAEPEAGSRRLIEFCGLEWDDACLRPQENERVVRTASSWQVRQPINQGSVERWRRYEPWLGDLKELLSSR